jgi:uncharacterized protein (TIGR03382 family)
MRLKEKLLAGLLLTPLAGTSVWAKDRVNFDAFLVSQEARSLSSTQEALQARGARVEQTEERLGVPTVLWNERHATERSSAMAGMRPEQAARTHLQRFADIYRLTSEDISSAHLQSVHKTEFGPVVARFGQQVEGIEVFRSGVNVAMDRNNNLVAITGYLTPHEAVAARRSTAGSDFRMSAAEAVARAFKDVTDTAISSRSLVAAGTQGDYSDFTFEPGVSAVMPHDMPTPARVKQVYFTLPGGLEPAWYVELNVGTKGSKDSDYYSYVVSATDGTLLFRNNLTVDDSFSFRVWADPVSFIPHDGPHGTDATPHPTGTPNRYQAPFIPPNLITLQNFPFSRNDPWLPPNASLTRGNNVDAYADLAAPDGFQPGGADLIANSTAPGAFDYTYDVTQAPGSSENQRKAAVAHLFYVNNYLHDSYYDFGFDEAAGNAQASNYGRGGLEGDSIKAEAQDYSGRNNANMSTPSDGSRPRMQMYVFDGLPDMRTVSPANIAGGFEVGLGAFGPSVYDLPGELKILNPTGTTFGCEPFPAGTFAGKIAVIDRGPLPPATACGFTAKALNAQLAGAIAVIIPNHTAGLTAPGMAGTDPAITVPVVSTTKEAGDAWKASAAAGNTISVRMQRGPWLDRDGTIDNAIVAHEWGHYISNRLVGNANGLTNNQGRSMGEGWADFHAMLMVVREEDRNKPGNNQYQGVYAVAGYTTSGGVNNGHYFGIRRVPYSTNMQKNALTYKHIAIGNPLPTHPLNGGVPSGAGNSQVHNSGEVWNTMLWECYASLLNAYPFQEAQNRMKSYLVAGYKLTPNAPTMLEARDALLAAAAAADPNDYQRFAQAFARRGAGFGAKGPDRGSMDHVGVVESYAGGNNLEVVSVRLDDGVTGCDQDGVLDVGETGKLTMKVRNSGIGALPSFTSFITPSGATATLAFPNGNTVQIPALPRGQEATVSVPVQLSSVTGAAPRAGITITFDEASLPLSAKSYSFNERVHYDEVLNGSAADTFEAQMTTWSSSLFNGTRGWQPANETVAGTPNRYMHVANPGSVSDILFTSPWVQVNPTGNFTMSFKYRHSLEGTQGGGGNLAPFYDGVVLELTVDDITWYDLFLDLGRNPGYTAFLQPGDNPLSERPAFVGTNSAFPGWNTANVNLGAGLAGLPVRFRFRMGSDSLVSAYGFDVDDVQFTNITPPPFSTRVAETSDGTVCNRRPIADVGPSPLVASEFNAQGQRTIVRFNGSASYDPDGQPLTYTWTQIAGDPITLTDANTATPSFEADTPYDNTYVFQLVVNDGVENSHPRTLIVTVLNVNHLPVAVATGPATVPERSVATIQLDGSASSDDDGEPLTYRWSQTAGPPVSLSNPVGIQPTFQTPAVAADTAFTFELVVNDGYADSAPASVTVVVSNVDRLPTANAGEDRTVDGRTLVLLSGTGSDEDGEPLSYAWTQLSGTSVTLTGANTARPSFASPDVKQEEVLSFQLTVTAGAGSTTDTVNVTVRADRAPTVNAGVDLFVAGRALVTLFGSASDADNDALTYAWTQLSGTPVTLAGADTATPSFTAPDLAVDDVLSFQLTVSANGLSTSDTVSITVRADSAPTVNAGADQFVNASTLVTLSGFATDADGDTISYAWTQVEGPSVDLVGGTTATPSFITPAVETQTVLRFQLTATANGRSRSDTVTITVMVPLDQAPTAYAGLDQYVDGRKFVAIFGSASDPDGDALTYSWTQESGPTVTLTGADSSVLTFTSPDVKQDAVLTFKLTVTANGKTTTDTVDINVRADQAPTANASFDRTAFGRTLVTITGFGFDLDGDTLTYAWSQLSGPSVTLTGANTDTLSFTSPDLKQEAVLSFQLTVTANGLSATDTVNVTVRADRAPTADAGFNMTVPGRELITLDGYGFDADGDTLTYAWSQLSGPAVTLTGADTAAPSFMSPDVKQDAMLSFQLTVTANGLSSTSTVTITVRADRAPAANAGLDRTVDGRTPVSLTGLGSDVEGDALTYAWTQVAGPAVTLTGADTATLSFVSPDVKQEAVLSFQLTVTANGLIATDTVDVTVRADRAPTANAGADRIVKSRDGVVLQGLGIDPEGDAITYAWTQVAGPAVTLTGANTATPSFTAPNVKTDTVVEFQLTITANGLSASDTVAITVRKDNRRPVGIGPNTMEEEEGSSVTLDASGSSDPDNDSLSFHWVQTGGPLVQFAGQDTASITFSTPEVNADTLVTFNLTVKDPDGAESEVVSVIVKVLNVNKGPTAQPRHVSGGVSGETVTLDALGSKDPDGDALTYKWEQTAGPEVSLSSTTEATVTFKAPDTTSNTQLTFKLTVTDAKGGTAQQTVNVEVTPAPQKPDEGGCSSTGSSSGAMLLALLAGVLLSRRRVMVRG